MPRPLQRFHHCPLPPLPRSAQLLPSSEHRHRVEGVERQASLLSPASDDIAARAGSTHQYVLKIVLMEVDDVLLISAARALDIPRDGQKADLHGFPCCLQYWPDSDEALLEHSLRRSVLTVPSAAHQTAMCMGSHWPKF